MPSLCFCHCLSFLHALHILTASVRYNSKCWTVLGPALRPQESRDLSLRHPHHVSGWQQKWDTLKGILCPAMKPNANPNIRTSLFDHGRIELGIATSVESPDTASMDERFINTFFSYQSGGVAYQSSVNTSSYMVYLRILK